ncbi:hypothetical protein [Plasmodium yoelii yoelii]|uniref:Uncharacterized protein n=1 Tax=Plasmodium yoelii yoelii TaxID=73239 RepID=Q7REE8_PLAYO|nr:hypothetical protein [Plasmodium yoelii yoelii]
MIDITRYYNMPIHII